MDATQERWLPVVGREGEYEVSDHGRVRSVDRTIDYIDGRSGKTCTRRARSTILRPATAHAGHQYVQLRPVTRTIHSLVAEVFIGPRPEEGMEVRHINGNPADNRPANLRWGTRSENSEDSKRHGTHFHAGVTECIRGHDLTDPANIQKTTSPRRTCLACRRERAALYAVGKQVTVDGLCINGHPKTPENRYTNGPRGTRCKPCALERRKSA